MDRYEPEPPPPPRTPASDARDGQLTRALEVLDRDTSQFSRFPWPALDAIIPGVAPGQLWMLAGYSGIAGKTTFLTSLALEWASTGTSVYYLPLETPDSEIWLRLACLFLGYSHGEIQTGVMQRTPEWPARAALLKSVIEGWRLEPTLPLYVHPADRADASVVGEAAQEAGMLNCDWFFIDHIDHLRGDPVRGDYGMSVDVTRRVDRVRKDDPGIRILCATQLNTDAVRGDPLAKVLTPLESHIKMGAHKREVSDGMLGLYRPLKPGTTADQLKQVRRRELDPILLIEPGQMGLEIMKDRATGRIGQQCVLGVSEVGRVLHLAERDRHSSTYDALRRF